MPVTELLSITEDIYDAATGGTSWDSVGQRLKRLVGAGSGWLVEQSPAGKFELLYAADFSNDAISSYQEHYHSVDLWVANALARSSGPLRTTISGSAIPDSCYTRSEFYSDFGR